MLNALVQRRFSRLAGSVISNNLRLTDGSSPSIKSKHSRSGSVSWLQSRRYVQNGRGDRKWWGRSTNERNNGDDKETLKVIRPETKFWDESSPGRILECKVAIVVAGASGNGLGAAHSLLRHGAKVVILADEEPRIGENAAQSLCDIYGKNRALFVRCDLGVSSCQLDDTNGSTYSLAISIETTSAGDLAITIEYTPIIKLSTSHRVGNTARVINTGLKYMGAAPSASDNSKNARANDAGSIIISGASIIGFMGWPEDPTPVYCFNKEPVAETSMDLAKIFPVEQTGVRIVALLNSYRPFAQLGLPDFPKENTKMTNDDASPTHCEPSGESRVGKALIHVVSRASTGTTWLSEPAPCLREIPWQIHFPASYGETVDPRIYDTENYTLDSESVVVPPSSTNCPANCEKQVGCKKLWKTKK